MNYFFAFLSATIFLLFALPFAKVYQLKGYNIQKFFSNFFEVKFSLKGKNRLAFTKRMMRFLILFFLGESVCWFLIYFYNKIIWLFIVDYLINFLIFPLVFVILHYILLPFEKFIKYIYILKLKRKFQNYKGNVIAITGSYGKTSVKNVLISLLSSKYKVLTTPKNFNTPMGLCKAFLKEDLNRFDIIVVEMGARHLGDIKELCEIVRPKFGVLTSIGNAHIETFGSSQNVLNGKFELCQSGKIDTCFFDCYSDGTKELFWRAKCKKVALGDEIKFNILSCGKYGSKFNIDFGEEVLSLNTSLLGEYACRNIALAVVVAKFFHITNSNIYEIIKKLKPVPHRLELIRNNEIAVIDDSYNSNFDGFIDALNVLKMFNGKRVLVTPGMVELGEKQFEFNYKVGKVIACSCDDVLIMNQTNRTAIKNGIESVNGQKVNLYFADDMQTQREILKDIVTKNSVVLFENDLPDDYV